MFFGGWLYPDTPSVAVAAAEVTSNEKEAFDCAAMGPAQATSAPTKSKRKCKVFRTDISSLRFDSPAKPIDKTTLRAGWWPITGEKSYVGETGKSTKGVELARVKRVWR
jgi:hypothetical protein